MVGASNPPWAARVTLIRTDQKDKEIQIEKLEERFQILSESFKQTPSATDQASALPAQAEQPTCHALQAGEQEGTTTDPSMPDDRGILEA